MAVSAAPTPNPNAMKFQVGEPVGGPATFSVGNETDNELATELLALEDVLSVFMTADFVTITKSSSGSWDAITPEATQILESHFPG